MTMLVTSSLLVWAGHSADLVYNTNLRWREREREREGYTIVVLSLITSLSVVYLSVALSSVINELSHYTHY